MNWGGTWYWALGNGLKESGSIFYNAKGEEFKNAV
jgi:hypothetical protein